MLFIGDEAMYRPCLFGDLRAHPFRPCDASLQGPRRILFEVFQDHQWHTDPPLPISINLYSIEKYSDFTG
jgi:hypothetical protein